KFPFSQPANQFEHVWTPIGVVPADLFYANTEALQMFFLLFLSEGADHDDIIVVRLHDARFRRQSEPRVEDDSRQAPAAGQAASVGQQRVIGNNGADTDHDRIRFVSQLLNMLTGGFAGDPAAGNASTCQGLNI